jgi:hypothetical protein
MDALDLGILTGQNIESVVTSERARPAFRRSEPVARDPASARLAQAAALAVYREDGDV